jgi:hypothetical protein
MAIHEVVALRSKRATNFRSLGIASFPFFQRLYFVQELLSFVRLALLVTFFFSQSDNPQTAFPEGLVMCRRQHSMGRHITDNGAEKPHRKSQPFIRHVVIHRHRSR